MSRMSPFVTEIDAFLTAREAMRARARQNAAFFLMCGVDLDEVLGSAPEERRKAIVRLERLIERERLKGSRRHWSYDLNRHIALKQAADRLRSVGRASGEAAHAMAPGGSATKMRRRTAGRQPL
jgi:hypothetical protein